MPWKAARPCAEPGCPALVRDGPRCPAHQLDRLDPDWPQIRAGYLALHPVCEAPGCGRGAVDVDHVLPRRDGGTDHWDNLRAYCHPHHAAKTAARDGGLGRARG